MGSQTLKLKWAGHTSNMTSELQELYLSGTLFDVTIACGEFSLKAHKTVLSASSTFFRKLFIDNPCKHPILIMTDVDFEDLKSIVEFMYQGEIHIYQEQLAQFLKTAERLKIKGLTNVENMNLNNHSELCDNSHFSNGMWEHKSTQPKSQDTTEREKAHNSSAKLTDCAQTHISQETQTVKSEDLTHSDNNSCIYWQSECFNQTSSNLLPDCIVASPPAVTQQTATTVSRKAPTPSISHDLLTPSTTHKYSTISAVSQLSSLSTSHELSNQSVSHQYGVPLNTEAFTSVECQSKSRTSVQANNESTGEDVVTCTESQISSGISTQGHHENTEKDVRCAESHVKNSSTSTHVENQDVEKAVNSRIPSQSPEESVAVTPSNADSSEVIQSLSTQSSSKDGGTDGDGEATNKLDQNHTDISRDSALSSMDSDRSSSDDEECIDYTSQAASFCEDFAMCSSVSPSPSLHSLSYCSSGSASSNQSPTPKKLQKLFRRKALRFHNRKNDDSENDDKPENQPQEQMHLKIEEHCMEEDYEDDLNSQVSKRPIDLNELSRQADLTSSTDIDQSIHHCYYYPYNIPLETSYDHKPFIQDKDADLEESRRDERRARELKIPIPNYDIINLPLEIFNERLSKYELNEAQLQLIRDIRRRGKNKVAAQNCRKRKLWQIMNLQEDLKILIDERNTLKAEQESILSYKRIITDKYNQLYELIKENTSSDPPLQILPDTLHQPNLNVRGDSSIPFDSTLPNSSDSGNCSKDNTTSE